MWFPRDFTRNLSYNTTTEPKVKFIFYKVKKDSLLQCQFQILDFLQPESIPWGKSYQIQFHNFLWRAWGTSLSNLPLGIMPIGGTEPLRVECISWTTHRSLTPQIVDTSEFDQSSKNESSANAHPHIYGLEYKKQSWSLLIRSNWMH